MPVESSFFEMDLQMDRFYVANRGLRIVKWRCAARMLPASAQIRVSFVAEFNGDRAQDRVWSAIIDCSGLHPSHLPYFIPANFGGGAPRTIE
jgi:hypothetical protein